MEQKIDPIEVSFSGPVNLKATLECGQAFRWKKVPFPGRPDLPFAYQGVVGACALTVGQDRLVTRKILVAREQPAADSSEGELSDWVRRYFSDGDDVEGIEKELASQGDVMAEAVRYGSGLRILTQDYWECLASYVLSANNSIRNISATIERLAERYGRPAGMGRRSFPDPRVVACQEACSLRQSKCGFRDKYLLDAASKVASGQVDLKGLEQMPREEARRGLMKIAGVGPKVADCVLLFAYHNLGVFPVDVWIARAVSRHYLGGRAVKPDEARREGERRFGDLAGYAQGYLFYWMRGTAKE